MREAFERRRLLGVATALGAAGLLRPATAFAAEKSEVNATEDLMREHGVLRRVLLIYEECIRRLGSGASLPAETVAASANVIRTFIEGYHEKLEETQVFPRLEKAHELVPLVGTLRAQHAAGRKLTAQILENAKAAVLADAKRRASVVEPMQAFIHMYRPHAAREDTVLFPAFHALFDEKAFDALGDQFEEQEHKLLGGGSFEGTLKAVEQLERSLGIYDLALFTPK